MPSDRYEEDETPASTSLLSGPMRAAAVLISLDTEIAVSILRELPGPELRELTRSMNELRADGMGPKEIHEALAEFRNHMGVTVEPTMRALLEQAFGRDRANELVGELEQEAGLRPFNMLRRLDGKQISVMISDEHPQLIALVASHLDREQVAELLAELPEDKRVDVIRRLANQGSAAPPTLARVSAFLRRKCEAERRGIKRVARTPADRLKSVADLLNMVEGGQRLLEQIAHDDADLAQQIKELMFVFEDISRLDRKAMQKVLSRADSRTLALALKAATPDVEENVFGNLSARARDAVIEERSLLGPVPITDVQAAQREILQVVQELNAEGDIQIDSGGATEYV